MSSMEKFKLAVLRQINKNPLYTDQTGNFQSYARLQRAFAGVDDDFIRLKASLRSLLAKKYLRLIDEELVAGETDIYQRYQLTPLGEEILNISGEVRDGNKMEPQRPKLYKNPRTFTLDHLHPEVKKVSKKLFADGHYSQAIFEAYKRVVNELKSVSGLKSFDGKPLAEKALSLNNPKIKLNDLQSQSDRDEQLGFMYLFAGAALGIRNPKAHDNIVQNDPIKALEYLSFASLLMRRLDERVNIDG